MQNFPTESELNDLVEGHKHSLLVVDDKGLEVAISPFIVHSFSRISHHKCISSILLLQNGGLKGKFVGDILRNAHYNVLLRGGKEAHAIRTLGIQL